MLKVLGSIVIVISCAGFLLSWRISCRTSIREMEQLCSLYRSARRRMQTEHVSMPLFFRSFASAADENPEIATDTMREEALCTFADTLAGFLEERTYPTGELAWQEAVKRTPWHLKTEALSLLTQSGGAFFGRNLSDNLQKLSRYEALMEELSRLEKQDFAEKNRVWTPVGLLLGILLVVIFV